MSIEHYTYPSIIMMFDDFLNNHSFKHMWEWTLTYIHNITWLMTTHYTAIIKWILLLVALGSHHNHQTWLWICTSGGASIGYSSLFGHTYHCTSVSMTTYRAGMGCLFFMLNCDHITSFLAFNQQVAKLIAGSGLRKDVCRKCNYMQNCNKQKNEVQWNLR